MTNIVLNVIRVAVVDDHPMFREGVAHLLNGVDGIEVVAEGATAADAVRIAQERAPNVMLLDIRIAGGGIEAAHNVARARPDTQVIMLTASEDEEHVASALRAGVRGYILKGSNGSELVRVVQNRRWRLLRRAPSCRTIVDKEEGADRRRRRSR